MSRLRRAGYNAPFTPLEDAVRDCVTIIWRTATRIFDQAI